MKLINKGDMVIGITQGRMGLYATPHAVACDIEDNRWCHAPDPEHEYRVGDWVLPVISSSRNDNRKLLIPVKVVVAQNHHLRVGDDQDDRGWVWRKSEIVHITRYGYEVHINDSCRLTVDEYKERYGVEELPVDEWAEREDEGFLVESEGDPAGANYSIEMQESGRYGVDELPEDEDVPTPMCVSDMAQRCELVDMGNNDWPKPEDIERYSGVFLHPADNKPWHVYPETVLSRGPELRDTLNGLERIEPIPPQCIPRDPQPRWVDEAVKLYHHRNHSSEAIPIGDMDKTWMAEALQNYPVTPEDDCHSEPDREWMQSAIEKYPSVSEWD